MSQIYAHSVSGKPQDTWETLSQHQAAVGRRAADFATTLGWAEVARLAGLLHDIGKLSPEFQAYIAGKQTSGGDHSSAGARIALDVYGPQLGHVLAAIIAGHHAGLANGIDLVRRMDAAKGLVPHGWQNQVGLLPSREEIFPTRGFNAKEGPKGFALSFLVRMLFSCLVDADYLATERFYEAVDRGVHSDLASLRDRLRAHMDPKIAQAESTPLNILRADILRHAVDKAALPPGLFTLTAPTGGGKTLASLSFALEHGVCHGLRRVIYVIPYTGAWIETSDERLVATDVLVALSRGRGSKQRQRTMETPGCASPSRGGVDRNVGVAGAAAVATGRPLAGAWIETVNYSSHVPDTGVALSRGRGSKLRHAAGRVGRLRRPLAGAWIETFSDRLQRFSAKVALSRGRGSKQMSAVQDGASLPSPSRGGVDRNALMSILRSPPPSRPLAGAWIETRRRAPSCRRPAVALSRGRGSKPPTGRP